MPLIITKITNASSSIEFNYLNSEHVWGLILNANYEFSIHDARMEDGDTLLEGIEALQNAYMRPNIAAKIKSRIITLPVNAFWLLIIPENQRERMLL